MTNGSHIMLDCTGAVGIDGDWMLSLMKKAVDASGARRVHSHIEKFDGTLSPPGFASVVLLDESHVSAHCYSDIGLLAIDAFSCGNTDPARIIEAIESEIRTKFPGTEINRRKRIERFLTEKTNDDVKGFVDEHFNHFNAGACAIVLALLTGF